MVQQVKRKRGGLWIIIAAVMIAIVLSSMFMIWAYTGRLPFQAGPGGEIQIPPIESGGGAGTGEPFYGSVELTTFYKWSYDLTAQRTSWTPLIYDASKSTSYTFDTSGSNVTFQVFKKDLGKAFLVLDFGTQTGFYFDPQTTKDKSRGFVTGWEPWDYDTDGTFEWCVSLDFSELPAIRAGEATQDAAFDVYVTKSDAANIGITSLTNVTGVSTSAYYDYSATGYYSGWSGEGYGFKVVRLQLVSPNSNNNTYVEDGNVKLQDIEITWNVKAGVKKYSGADIDWQLANSLWEIKIPVTDRNNEYYGMEVYRYRGDAATAFAWKVHILAKFAAASKLFLPTLKTYIINPAGTLTNIQQVISFAS